MDELIKQISRYQKGSSQIRTKLSKLRAAHKSVTQSIRVHEVLAVTSQKDAITGTALVLQFVSHTHTIPYHIYVFSQRGTEFGKTAVEGLRGAAS
jgi:hypothetical protein